MNCSVFIGMVAAVLVSNAAIAQQMEIGSGSIEQTLRNLRPGQYVWLPKVAPSGPMLLVVNLATQRAMLFRNGIPIGATTVSTGRPGYPTPTGVFSVLQKHVEHYSATYDNAPMPFMQRLTWRGVALHAGNLPGYPASHGCIRLPKEFAKLLYGITHLGMTVVITNHLVTPRIAPTPELVLRPSVPPVPADATVEWHPERSPSGPVSIVVSAADRRAVVLRNGVIIGSAPVTVDGVVDGSWAYVLKGGNGEKQWMRLPLRAGDDSSPVPSEEWTKFHGPELFRRAVAAIVVPGSTIVVTSDSLIAGSTSAPVKLIEDSGD